jgi:hypothetical protein
MNTKKILLILLLVVAAYMIYLGVKADMKPPIFTGVGFVIISLILGKKDN